MDSLITPETQAKNAAALKERENAFRALSDAYRLTFRGPLGALVWEDMQGRAFLTTSTIDKDDQGRIDAFASLINEGARQFGLYIQAMIAAGERGPEQREEPTHAETIVT